MKVVASYVSIYSTCTSPLRMSSKGMATTQDKIRGTEKDITSADMSSLSGIQSSSLQEHLKINEGTVSGMKH